MEKKIDRRILKTKRAIESTFVEMLIKDGFDQITIKDITEKADISRKTFYLHYVDKYDLLDKIVNVELEKLEKICDEKKEKGIIEGTVIWFKYFEENKIFFGALFASNNTVSFRKRLLEFMMNELRKKMKNISLETNIEILTRFLGMAILGIIESFVLDELNNTTEEIAKEVGRLVEENLSLSNK